MKLSRWLLFIPAGLFEVFLLILAGFTCLVGRWHEPANDLTLAIIEYAKSMPGMKWYLDKEK